MLVKPQFIFWQKFFYGAMALVYLLLFLGGIFLISEGAHDEETFINGIVFCLLGPPFFVLLFLASFGTRNLGIGFTVLSWFAWPLQVVASFPYRSHYSFIGSSQKQNLTSIGRPQIGQIQSNSISSKEPKRLGKIRYWILVTQSFEGRSEFSQVNSLHSRLVFIHGRNSA